MEEAPNSQQNRRPLAVRSSLLAQKAASKLNRKGITPNQISLMSIVFALCGLICGLFNQYTPSGLWSLLLAFAIQLRLICNLLDGMVAIEGGQQTPAGELFNDVPDRIADPLLILGAGLMAQSDISLHLAWCVAILAVLTAYVRVMGVSLGCPQDFRGPMAKQHRMALLTLACVLLFVHQSIVELHHWMGFAMDAALWIMLVGCVITLWRRLKRIYHFKNQQASGDGQC